MFALCHERRIKYGSKYTFTFLLDSMGTAINKMLDSQTGKTYIVHRYKTNTTMQGPQITVPLQDLQISWIQESLVYRSSYNHIYLTIKHMFHAGTGSHI